MPDEKKYTLQFTSTADTAGIDETARKLDGLTEAAKKSTSGFDELYEVLKGSVLANVITPGDKAAFEQALDESRAKLKETFDSGDAKAFAAEVANLTEKTTELAHANGTWNPAEDAARWATATTAVKDHAEALKVTDSQAKQLAKGVAGMAISIAGGTSPTAALTTGITALATVAGGPVVGALTAGVIELAKGLVGASDAAKKIELETIKKGADAAAAGFRNMADALRDELGAALDEQKEKLATFLSDWKSAQASIASGYARKQGQADDISSIEDVETDAEEQLALANAPDEDHAAIKSDFKRIREDQKRARGFENLDLAIEKNAQDQKLAAEGEENAKRAEQQARGQISGADETIEGFGGEMAGDGIYSDQRKRAAEYDELLKRRAEVDRNQRHLVPMGSKRMQQKRIDDARLEQLEPIIDEDIAAIGTGRETFNEAEKDNLTPWGRNRLEQGKKDRANAVALKASGEENLKDAGAARTKASKERGDLRDQGGRLDTQRDVMVMRDDQIDTRREVEDSASQEAAERVATAAEQGGSNSAQSLDKIATSITEMSGKFSAAIATLTTAVASANAKADQAQQTAEQANSNAASEKKGSRYR